ncbi:MAG: TIGR04282 family arsenosugar biosynthesis glycosyltransferase [Acidobacteriota bacterium]|nr:TIGR04282 family arsenosugar biosynthesis glycosyltransferase [Acidobacteriota bacterium]
MKNALICFLKFPEPGNVKTRLAADLEDPVAAAVLYEALAERVITEVYPLMASYDVLLYVDSKHEISAYRKWIGDSWQFHYQYGDDLGTRLNDAFANTFKAGYSKVAVIGTDCVGMDQAFVEEVFNHLDHHDYVIGPSTDGGYYLLAAREDSPWLFENVDWSTESVLETTLDKIETREKDVFQLIEKIDIDTLDDLVSFRESLPPEHFLAAKINSLILDKLTLEGDPDEILEKL